MSLLGFDALGRLALGQLPFPSSNQRFSSFADTPPRKTNIAVVSTTYVGFIPVRVSTPTVFTQFSQPRVTKPLQTQQGFVTQPVAPVVISPVFTRFSDPIPTKARIIPEVNFRVLRPDAATPGPLVFTKFSEPFFVKVRPQSDTNSSFFVAPVVTTVVTGGDFAAFDLVQSRKGQQQGWTGFISVPPIQTPVFTQFSQPQVKVSKEGNIGFIGSLGPASTPPWFVFTPFKEVLSKKPQLDPTGLFLGDLGPAQTPPWFVFSSFSQPQAARTIKEGNVSTSLTTVIQSIVFGRFEQPVTKRVLQQDNSFVNLPVVQVVTQPYVFSDFGQPVYKKVLQDLPVNFTVFPQPVIITQVTFSGFSDFGTPRKAGFIQPDFLDSPIPAIVQNYVFTQFSQPQLKKQIYDQPTWFAGTTLLQPYVFSSFAQPQSRLIQQAGQSFVNLPVVITVTQPYLFSPFDTPQFRKAPQFDTSVQFQVLPPPQIISVVTFTGFSEFGSVRSRSFLAALYPSVLYDIFVPIVLPEDVLLGGKFVRQKEKVHHYKVESSTVDMVIHDKAAKALTVKFNTGREYTYNNVDDKKVKGLVTAKSSGKYLHNNIKGKYFTTRMK